MLVSTLHGLNQTQEGFRRILGYIDEAIVSSAVRYYYLDSGEPSTKDAVKPRPTWATGAWPGRRSSAALLARRLDLSQGPKNWTIGPNLTITDRPTDRPNRPTRTEPTAVDRSVGRSIQYYMYYS